jgi:hypothetical protein
MIDSTDNLVSNKDSMLAFLEEIRLRVEADEILQMMIVLEDGEGFDAKWTASESRFAICGFTINAAVQRMMGVNASGC